MEVGEDNLERRGGLADVGQLGAQERLVGGLAVVLGDDVFADVADAAEAVFEAGDLALGVVRRRGDGEMGRREVRSGLRTED